MGEAEQSVEFYINMTDALLTRWWGKEKVTLKFDFGLKKTGGIRAAHADNTQKLQLVYSNCCSVIFSVWVCVHTLFMTLNQSQDLRSATLRDHRMQSHNNYLK